MTKATLFALALLLSAVAPGRSQAAGQAVGVVYFTEWSALLDDAAKDIIKHAADTLGSGSGTATVTGYADKTGSAESNDLLSALRAQLVIDQLVSDGVGAGRLKRAEKGATVAIGSDNESRRVVIRLDAE